MKGKFSTALGAVKQKKMKQVQNVVFYGTVALDVGKGGGGEVISLKMRLQ